MSRFINAVIASGILAATGIALGAGYEGIGRTATPAEIKAWDIDVRPDFKGLPPGSGSVSRGQEIWDAKCASCHGTFGESNEVFTPIIGGTTKEDIKNGRVAALSSANMPQRTTLMKVSTISTLWDYIHRAMPWNAPKSLSNDDVYAVLAYILNLGDIVPEDFTLSDKNIADVQKLLPNRNGTTRAHGLWDVKGKPDVKNVACMKNCPTEAHIASALPDFARNAHGNLADQNRMVGAIRGADTSNVAGVKQSASSGAPTQKTASASQVSGKDLANKSGCLACHGISNKIVGPAFTDVAAKYKDDTSAEAKLIAKVKSGGQGAWGSIPMPPQEQLKDDDIKSLVNWVLGGAK